MVSFDLETSSSLTWAEQSLTLDRLIEGLIDGKDDYPALPLVDGNAQAIPETLPGDEASFADTKKQDFSCSCPVDAEEFAGAYAFRGRVPDPDKKPCVTCGYADHPMEETKIECPAISCENFLPDPNNFLLLGRHEGIVHPRT